jgi:hypothetical protein
MGCVLEKAGCARVLRVIVRNLYRSTRRHSELCMRDILKALKQDLLKKTADLHSDAQSLVFSSLGRSRQTGILAGLYDYIFTTVFTKANPSFLQNTET